MALRNKQLAANTTSGNSLRKERVSVIIQSKTANSGGKFERPFSSGSLQRRRRADERRDANSIVVGKTCRPCAKRFATRWTRRFAWAPRATPMVRKRQPFVPSSAGLAAIALESHRGAKLDQTTSRTQPLKSDEPSPPCLIDRVFGRDASRVGLHDVQRPLPCSGTRSAQAFPWCRGRNLTEELARGAAARVASDADRADSRSQSAACGPADRLAAAVADRCKGRPRVPWMPRPRLCTFCIGIDPRSSSRGGPTANRRQVPGKTSDTRNALHLPTVRHDCDADRFTFDTDLRRSLVS